MVTISASSSRLVSQREFLVEGLDQAGHALKGLTAESNAESLPAKLSFRIASKQMPLVKYTAATADRYVLYEEAVQNVEFEVGIIDRFYKKYRQKKPLLLREDFCGTFLLSCQWVRRNKAHFAIGVDLDPKPLAWGKKHNLSRLKEKQQQRIQIIQDNVLNVTQPHADVVAAFNFSYWIFRKPEKLLHYFHQVYRSLKSEGMFLMDAFGGTNAEAEQEEKRKCDGFVYSWEHSYFYPITREMGCKIHFHFRDGSELRNAFVYHWRLWTPPEISNLLSQAGFSQVHWYLEGTEHETGEGNGVFRQSKRGETAETWIAYALALK